jgi:hypothetical protein
MFSIHKSLVLSALSLVAACQTDSTQPLAAHPTPLANHPAADPRTASVEELPSSSAKARPVPSAREAAFDDTAEEGWAFLIKPYVFAAGMSGIVATPGHAINVEASFDDILDHFDIGGMLALEMSPPDSNWTFLVDLVYLRLDDEGTSRGPGAVTVEAQLEEFVGEVSVAYEILEAGRFDVLGGLRYWNIGTDLTAHTGGGSLEVGGSEDWIDPLVGARTRLPLAERFDLLLRGDIGGFGSGSEFATNLLGEVGWTMSEACQLALGYRYVYVDYRGDITFDMAHAGPTLGIEIRF